MDIILSISKLIVLLIILVKSADILQDSSVNISKKIGFHIILIGLFIIGVTSSSPEVFVALNAIKEGIPSLALGNLIGGNIIILSLIVGIYAFKNGGIDLKQDFSFHELVYALLVILAQIAVVFDGNLIFIEGVLLIVMYVLFLVYMIKKIGVSDLKLPRNKRPLLIEILKGIFGLIVLVFVANFAVTEAEFLGRLISIPPILLGLVVFSMGTNLPEIIISLTSKGGENSNLAFGNFIGSAMFNTFTLGLLIVLNPFVATNIARIIPALIVLVIIIFTFGYFAYTDKRVSKKEAIFLISIFVLFILSESLLAS